MADIDVLDRFTTSSVETFFDSLLRGRLTDNLFYNSLPTNIRKRWKECAVVDVANPMRDYDSHMVGTVLVFLYAKQNDYGIKNVKVLQEQERKLNRLIEESRDEHYHISRRGSYSNYDAVNDIYYNVVQINLIVT